jgi:DNA-3-methyladenine glycosylase I
MARGLVSQTHDARPRHRPVPGRPRAEAAVSEARAFLWHARGGDVGAVPDGIVHGEDGRRRCWWCGQDALYRRYHDEEWGFPVTDERRLFEKLCLEGFQAGLSWLTILRKREQFRQAFAGFDFEKVARFDRRAVDRLLGDAGIVRHRGKIESAINNARRACDLVDEFGSVAAYVWRFEPDPRSRPARLTRRELMSMSTSPESKALSGDLKRRGWSFVGPTTVYAFMQAMGLVNDHLDGCFVRPAAAKARRRHPVP